MAMENQSPKCVSQVSEYEYFNTIAAYQRLLEANYELRQQLQTALSEISSLTGRIQQQQATLATQEQALRKAEARSEDLLLGAESLAATLEDRNIQVAWMQTLLERRRAS
jgi:cell division septum initiation protein DivIVA